MAQLKFKYGTQSKMQDTSTTPAIAEGTLYFTHNSDNDWGRIYFDVSSSKRVLVGAGDALFKAGVTPNDSNDLYLVGSQQSASGITSSQTYTNTNVYITNETNTKGILCATRFDGPLNGNASTATAFASAQSVALTGDVTGSASSTAGWSIATTIGTGKVTNDMLAGSIAASKLAGNIGNSLLTNSSMTIAGNSVSLGGSLDAGTLRTSLGLSNAMHFIGKATVAITDGSTTDPTITGYDFTNVAKGDVIIDSSEAYEYVWTAANKWERLGPDGSYKTVQTAVSDPTASGSGINYIATISQNANGEISVTKSTVRSASTSQTGVVQLSDAVNNTSTTLAATANAVKTSYDLAAAAIPKSIGTAAGDIIYWSAASTPVRLAKGSDGQVLKLSGGVPTWGTDNNTLNTAGSTDTSSKIFLVGATSQAANPQTYSDNQVYATNGQLDANKVRIAEAVTLQYNSTTKSLDFIFA